MIPVLTAEQMRTADAAALGSVADTGVFIRRAGHATAMVARKMMGGAYGRRVTVVAGKGHNGDDGRVAASWLTQWGAKVSMLAADESAGRIIDGRSSDLVIDAAYGIGFRGTWSPPIVIDVPVLAVDLPSGLDATTGSVAGGVLVADRTVTFAAVKSGMLFADGPSICGEIDLVDVGIDAPADCATHLIERGDVERWIPVRERDAHKWHHAVRVVAGSDGMGGAASLVSAAAMRAGAGIVHLSWRGAGTALSVPTEVVGRSLPTKDWSGFVNADIARFKVMVVGPGLGRGDDVGIELRAMLEACPVPVVVDGDGLAGIVDPNGGHTSLSRRGAATVLTPHDGEFAALGGDTTHPDRIAATRELARATGCVVVRKGPTTVVCDHDGEVALSVSGDERLATAGSGDVLAGIIGAFIARGMTPFAAAAAGAHVHGLAASKCPPSSTIARDLVAALVEVFEEMGSDVG